MPKSNFKKNLAVALGVRQQDANYTTEVFIETLRKTILTEGSVVFPGYFSFKLLKKNCKTRNPRTGEVSTVDKEYPRIKVTVSPKTIIKGLK